MTPPCKSQAVICRGGVCKEPHSILFHNLPSNGPVALARLSQYTCPLGKPLNCPRSPAFLLSGERNTERLGK